MVVDRRAQRQRLERRREPVLEHRRVEAARELAQLAQRQRELVARRSHELLRRRVVADAGPGAGAAASAIATSRCWAPSWRLRSSRRRSASPAATMRSRDACSSTTRAPSSACRRSRSMRDVRGRAHHLEQLRLVRQRGVVDERGDVPALVARRTSPPAPSPPPAASPAARRRRRRRRSAAASRRARATGRRAPSPARRRAARGSGRPLERDDEVAPSRRARAAGAGCRTGTPAAPRRAGRTVTSWLERMNSPVSSA